MPEVSIIIITFNAKDFLISCLDSVFSQVYTNFEVIVVDNGSKDKTADFIKENYSSVILIENDQNLGACKARNQGIEKARGEWILALDCDATLEKDFLNKIMSFAKQQDESIGIFAPKILRSDKKTIYSCGIKLSKIRRFYDIGSGKADGKEFNLAGNIFGACCASAVYRRKMLESVKEETGYFDERFFFLVEDVDLSWRAQRKGWKALYFPWAYCFHSGNSSGYDKRNKQCLCFRNRYLMILKNERSMQLLSSITFMFVYDLARLFYLAFTNRKALKAFGEIARQSWRS